MQTTDIGTMLDEGPWSRYQKLLVVGTALTIILDGLDNQLLGAAIPALMREWRVPGPAFASVQASGMVGMMIGGATGGFIGDRIGRRAALLGSVLSFGVLTVLISFAAGVTTLYVAVHDGRPAQLPGGRAARRRERQRSDRRLDRRAPRGV